VLIAVFSVLNVAKSRNPKNQKAPNHFCNAKLSFLCFLIGLATLAVRAHIAFQSISIKTTYEPQFAFLLAADLMSSFAIVLGISVFILLLDVFFSKKRPAESNSNSQHGSTA